MKLLAIRNFSGFLPLSFLILLSQRLQKVHKVQKLQCHEIKVVQFNVHSSSQEIVLVEFSWSLSASSTPPSWLPVQIMPQYHKSLTLVVVLHSITQYHTSTSITLVSHQYQYYTSIPKSNPTTGWYFDSAGCLSRDSSSAPVSKPQLLFLSRICNVNILSIFPPIFPIHCVHHLDNAPLCESDGDDMLGFALFSYDDHDNAMTMQ